MRTLVNFIGMSGQNLTIQSSVWRGFHICVLFASFSRFACWKFEPEVVLIAMKRSGEALRSQKNNLVMTFCVCILNRCDVVGVFRPIYDDELSKLVAMGSTEQKWSYQSFFTPNLYRKFAEVFCLTPVVEKFHSFLHCQYWLSVPKNDFWLLNLLWNLLMRQCHWGCVTSQILWRLR